MKIALSLLSTTMDSWRRRASWRCCSLVSRTKAVWKACVPTSILDIDTEQAISLPSGRRKVASR